MANTAADGQAPIIVKRIKKSGGHGHHGGAWKVAYADFVTAMMAFFMLLWLMGSTTEQQKKAIADFFQYPSTIEASGGASDSFLQIADRVPDSAEDAKEDGEGAKASENVRIEQQTLEELQAEEELLGMEYLMETMREAIENNEVLKKFEDQLLVDMTSEGLRIQLVDKENRPMFERGSAAMQPYARALLKEIVGVVRDVPNRVSIAGHTDAHEYASVRGYTNWELSADRANTARRELLGAGMPAEKLARVVGLASSVLLNANDPYDPANRRISITIMNRASEEAVIESQGPGESTASRAAVPTGPSDAPAAGLVPERRPSIPATTPPPAPATGRAAAPAGRAATPVAATTRSAAGAASVATPRPG